MNRNEQCGALPSDCAKISVKQQTHIIFGVHQEDERTVGVAEFRRYLDLGIAVLVKDGRHYKFHSCTERNQNIRDVYLELTLPPGEYIFLPLSSGCSLRRPSGRQPQEIALMTSLKTMHPLFQSTIRDIFRRFDRNMSQDLGIEEFRKLIIQIGFDLPLDKFTDIILNRFTSTENGVTIQGLFEMFMVGCEEQGEQAVRGWLEALGYDQDLYSIESRALVLDIHASNEIEIVMDRGYLGHYLIAWDGMMQQYGHKSNTLGTVDLWVLQHEIGVTVMARNFGANDAQVFVDFSHSKNVDFLKDSQVKVELMPQEWAWVTSLQCKKDVSEFSYCFEVSKAR